VLVGLLPLDREDQYILVLDLTLPMLGYLEVIVHLKVEASHSHINGLLRLFPSCSFYLDGLVNPMLCFVQFWN
jgi:hypothetical protein